MDKHSRLIARNVSDEEKLFYNIDTQSVENGVASATAATVTTATVSASELSTTAVTASATTTSIATTAVEVKQVEVIGQESML